MVPEKSDYMLYCAEPPPTVLISDTAKHFHLKGI